MKMASRVNSAWQRLAAELQGVAVSERRFFERLRSWLTNELGATSKFAAQALDGAGGIELVLEGDPATFPISPAAAEEFQRALREASPKDPLKLVLLANELCWKLAVFAHSHSCCPQCQGDQEQWTDGEANFEICNLLGCCVYPSGKIDAPPQEGIRPMTRDEVLRRFPDVELLLVT